MRQATLNEAKEWLKENLDNIITFAGGGAQVFVGTALCSTGGGCVVGALLVAHGMNNMYEAMTDKDGAVRKTYQKFLGRKVGNIAYGGVDIGTSVVGLTRSVLKPNTWKLFKNIPDDYTASFKTASELSLGATVVVDLNTTYDTIRRNEK